MPAAAAPVAAEGAQSAQRLAVEGEVATSQQLPSAAAMTEVPAGEGPVEAVSEAQAQVQPFQSGYPRLQTLRCTVSPGMRAAF